MKTCPYIIERLLMGRKESNQINKQIIYSDGFSTTDNTVRIVLSITCFKGYSLEFTNYDVLQSLKIGIFLASSADPDEMQHSVAFYLVFTVC